MGIPWNSIAGPDFLSPSLSLLLFELFALQFKDFGSENSTDLHVTLFLEVFVTSYHTEYLSRFVAVKPKVDINGIYNVIIISIPRVVTSGILIWRLHRIWRRHRWTEVGVRFAEDLRCDQAIGDTQKASAALDAQPDFLTPVFTEPSARVPRAFVLPDPGSTATATSVNKNRKMAQMLLRMLAYKAPERSPSKLAGMVLGIP